MYFSILIMTVFKNYTYVYYVYVYLRRISKSSIYSLGVCFQVSLRVLLQKKKKKNFKNATSGTGALNQANTCVCKISSKNERANSCLFNSQ